MILTRPGFALTPYHQRIAFRVFTGAVVVSVAWALAGLTWRLAGHAGTGAITVPVVQRTAPVPDLAPILALAPFGRGAPDDAAPPTALAIQLRGIILARPESMSSAFIAANGEAPKAFSVGDAILSGTIETIQRHRILLRNGGRLESLAMPDPFGAPPTTAAAPNIGGAAPAPAPAPVAAPAPAVAVADVLAKFDATPTSGGYAVGERAPPGLQPGDVLQSVNGQALASPDAARDAFAKAQSAGTAQLQIMRDGKRVTLTVPIR